MDGRPSGTVTFLFTDIEGSTLLWDAHPDAMRAALARHDTIVRDAIGMSNGFVFSTGGDGFAAAFQRAGDAVAAAVAAQRSLRSEVWPDATRLKVRMGLHTGEAQERDGDYFGPPVNRASRVMAAAHGGQIVLSSGTAGILGHGPDIELVDLGEHRLKGIVEPMRMYRVRAAGLAIDDRPPLSTREIPGNLSRPLTDWIGSVAMLRERAADLLMRRLVTLTGTGGVGKTRTAIEVAWLIADEFPGGVWFHDLAPVADPDSVATAIASTLKVAPQPGASTIEAIVDWLRGRRLLMILDNCEHVMAPVAELVTAIAARCDTVTVLATSREPLGVAGERVVPVPSLAGGDAVALFRERAGAADAGLVFAPGDEAVIATICERLDGIPLAIELAAARVRSAAPTELLARITDRFRLLRGSGRGGLERHQTLRATVAWSYQLLKDAEQALFDRLSVCAGTFDAAAAESIAADGVVDQLDVIDLLDSLVDKSMLIAERQPDGTRYRLLETLRQYGEEKLTDRGETALVRDRHLIHYVTMAERAYPIWLSARQLDADAIFDREWDNLRAAHDWALTSGDQAVAERLVVLVSPHAQTQLRTEVGAWAERTLALATPESPAGADLFGRLAHWAFFAADYAGVLALADRAIAAAPTVTHPDTVLARAFAVDALAMTGRGAYITVLIGPLQEATRAATDVFTRAWGWSALCLVSPGGYRRRCPPFSPSSNAWPPSPERPSLGSGPTCTSRTPE